MGNHSKNNLSCVPIQTHSFIAIYLMIPKLGKLPCVVLRRASRIVTDWSALKLHPLVALCTIQREMQKWNPGQTHLSTNFCLYNLVLIFPKFLRMLLLFSIHSKHNSLSFVVKVFKWTVSFQTLTHTIFPKHIYSESIKCLTHLSCIYYHCLSLGDSEQRRP